MSNDTKVDVYYNLHKKCLSVRDCDTRRVSKHLDHVVLNNVTFKVSESGRQRVLRDRCKNVHAYVRGVVDSSACCSDERFVRVTYNPYKYSTFVRADDETPVHKAQQVIINGRNIMVLEHR